LFRFQLNQIGSLPKTLRAVKDNPTYGIYGLRLEGFVDPTSHLLTVPENWPMLSVSRIAALGLEDRPSGTIRIGDSDAAMWLADGTRFAMTRDPLTLRIASPEPMSDEALLHPYLSLPAAIASWWLGRQVFHGAAFAHRGRAWAILGDREAGKSSTLAALVRRGGRPLSDDLLAIDGTTLYAGPAHIDLREDASEVLGGAYVGILGNRARWRLRHAPSVVALPLGGFIVLEWGSDVRIEVLEPHERLPYLLRGSELALGPTTAPSLLELLALPAWRAARPRDYAGIDAFAATVLATIDQL
jgi:hypothetical protein